MYVEPDDPSKSIVMLIDSKGSGIYDVIYIDHNRKDWFDEVLYDTVGDGHPHLIGYLKKGASEPYKYEPYTEPAG
jgi:hypothetical protein